MAQVIKLDIDNSEAERQIIAGILADSTLLSMIGEMFFEMHFRSRIFGEKLNIGWGDVISQFSQLRKLGLPIHYWP